VPRSAERTSSSREVLPTRGPTFGMQIRPAATPKRTFFSFIRHPFRRPETRRSGYIPRPFCPKGHCAICPGGQARNGGCMGATAPRYVNNSCSHTEVWNGGACLLHTNFLADCSALALAMERQEQRMRAAESMRQSACGNSAAQECLDANREWQSEQSLYRAWESRYRRCQSETSTYPAGGYSFPGYGLGVWPDAAGMNVNY
jgi:hypothetical protein